MNIFKKIYCRTFQTVFKLILPILPYREPKLLTSNSEVSKVLIDKKIKKVLLLTDKSIKELGLTKDLENNLKSKKINYEIFDNIVPNPTTENVEQALNVFYNKKCEALIAFGGGSVMDCAKAVGARVAKPNKSLKQMKGILKVRKKTPLLIAVPTTAGTGSETTLAAVITDAETRHKYAINDFPLIPSYALLDAKLTENLPRHITSTTGMDALTHAIEAYIGNSTTKKTRAHALNAIKLIFENLPEAYHNGHNLKARKNMLKAAYEAGIAFTQSYVGYVHAIAHTLGGQYNTPHGLANAVILPYVLKTYNKKIHKKLWKIGVFANLFDKKTTYETGAKILIEKIEQLNKEMNIPAKLDCIKKEDIPNLSKIAEKEANPLYPVPVLMTSKELEKIYYQIIEN